MMWDNFLIFSIISMLLWITGACFSFFSNKKLWAVLFTSIGILVFGYFIILLWIEKGHPPMRTLGETRLLYSFFMPCAGLVTYVKWKYRWILPLSTVMALVFIVINVVKPEIHYQNLMPALQSNWFAPHVMVYMFGYTLMACSVIISIYGIFSSDLKKHDIAVSADNLVYTGYVFLTFGMFMGAFWGKSAWGHYWNWDPKETWAAITWLSYLLYIHYRLKFKNNFNSAFIVNILAFLFLQMCWWGLNFLPVASQSVHTYFR